MSQTHSGSCLCGAVHFRVDGGFDRFYLCHCQHCRKDTGSAHAANLFASAARLHWLSGAEQVRHYTLAGTRHTRAFCGTCGSALPSLQMDGHLLVVPAGSLDSPLAQQPDAHLFTASRAGWDAELQTLPKWPGLPS